MTNGDDGIRPNLTFPSAIKGIVWFLFLLGVWLAIVAALWSEHNSRSSFGGELSFIVTLIVAGFMGTAIILILTAFDIYSQKLTFPRSAVFFAGVAVGVNALLIAILVWRLSVDNRSEVYWSDVARGLHGLRPFFAVTTIMVVRNFARGLMAWARADIP